VDVQLPKIEQLLHAVYGAEHFSAWYISLKRIFVIT
jgi:hypothetical protein